MSRLKNNSSAISNCREPLAPVTSLEQVPVAFYELLDFAMHSEDPLAPQMVRLIRSVIEITQIDPEGLAKLPYVVTAVEAL